MSKLGDMKTRLREKAGARDADAKQRDPNGCFICEGGTSPAVLCEEHAAEVDAQRAARTRYVREAYVTERIIDREILSHLHAAFNAGWEAGMRFGGDPVPSAAGAHPKGPSDDTGVRLTPLTSCDLPPRVALILENSRIYTLGELADRQRREIWRMRGVGDVSMARLDALLKCHGLQWSEG